VHETCKLEVPCAFFITRNGRKRFWSRYEKIEHLGDTKHSVTVAGESIAPEHTDTCFKEHHFGTLSAINTKENEETK
jgi:hypothetical protein